MKKNPALYKALLEQKAAEKSLYKFIELMWQFVEPANEFVGNWHLEALCLHLEAVTNGEITRLLINVPPGTAKSLVTDVFWPAWEWIRMPHMRYICTSYSQDLTERDNIRFKQIITSDLYQAMWASSFAPSKSSFSVTKVANDRTGWKLASSVGGIGTGERANRVICFVYDTFIQTDKGCIKIGDIVSRRLQLRVAGYDHSKEKVVWQEIEEYEENPTGDMIEIDYGDNKITCTTDHLIYVDGKGYIKAEAVQGGDILISW